MQLAEPDDVERGEQPFWGQVAQLDDVECGEPPFWGQVAQSGDVERGGHVRRGELFGSIMGDKAFVWV